MQPSAATAAATAAAAMAAAAMAAVAMAEAADGGRCGHFLRESSIPRSCRLGRAALTCLGGTKQLKHVHVRTHACIFACLRELEQVFENLKK